MELIGVKNQKLCILKEIKLESKIICVDYDGTLCEDKFPEIGNPKPKVIEWVINQRKIGHKLILWTCREGMLLLDAVKWCASHGIEFDAINENLPEAKFLYVGKSKAIADIYLDDKSMKVSDVDSLLNAKDFQKGQ